MIPYSRQEIDKKDIEVLRKFSNQDLLHKGIKSIFSKKNL